MPNFDPSHEHPLYEKWKPKWFRQRCLLEGEDRIKEPDVDEIFLPRLEGQSGSFGMDAEPQQVVFSYQSYKTRAVLFNALARTREGLVGAIMRKEPELEWPGEKEELEYLGFGYESFQEIINETLDEMVGVGRYGQLVDMAPDEVGEDRPYISSYIGESITDWELAVIKGRKQLVRVTLKEKGPTATTGSELRRYRVLWLGFPEKHTAAEEKKDDASFLAQYDLTEADLENGPIYFQEVWVEVEAGGKKGGQRSWVRESLVVPTKVGGSYWDEIPFTFFNTTTTRPKPEKPSLLDLATVNIGHYRNSADKEHGLHFTGLPQPWLAGFKFKNHLFIGSGAAWVSEDSNAKAGYMEVQGDFKGLTDEMERKEKRMASLGGRILEEQTPAGSQEAMGTVKMRQSGDRSTLARISLTASEGLTKTLRFVCMFKGDDSDKASVRLNLDFGTESVSPTMLTALMTAVQQGLMSWDTFVYNLKKGELYPEEWDMEKEGAAVKVGVPGRSLDELLNPAPDTEGVSVDDATPQPNRKPKNKKPKK